MPEITSVIRKRQYSFMKNMMAFDEKEAIVKAILMKYMYLGMSDNIIKYYTSIKENTVIENIRERKE